VPDGAITALYDGGEYARAGTLGEVYAQRRYVIGQSVAVDGRIAGYLFISADMSSMAGVWRQFSQVFVLLALTVLCVTFIVSLMATKRQAEPIKAMWAAARRFARGDFSARIEETGRDDEIGQLESAFNAMADTMEKNEQRRRELIANVSHELKTPMTVISGFADGILDGTIPKEQEAKYLETISYETKRLNRMVRSMLDISALEEREKPEEHFDIGEVIAQTLLGLTARMEGKSLDAQVEMPEEPVITVGDKDAITQIAYNLIDNAVKFAREGTALRVVLWKQGGKAHISVENHGDTIPKDELPMIFDRFHKADKSRRMSDGVGLGLYIVKTILNRHKEDIYVTSSDGMTRFTFTLKLSQNTGRGK
jgi:signal transduction histidine kinase